ncbi:unnamed protein product [Adineta ricciae]|uniref:Uncharacterized protein n=1 Tax=Adineta ricciae TaxID=249248 RepID=A0A815ZT18_ADIRI|nr:unnamed protein product [Adineta ricciae]
MASYSALLQLHALQSCSPQPFKKFIPQFFKDDKPEYPYVETIQCSIGQDPKVEYHLTITIRQPTVVTSI